MREKASSDKELLETAFWHGYARKMVRDFLVRRFVILCKNTDFFINFLLRQNDKKRKRQQQMVYTKNYENLVISVTGFVFEFVL